MRLRVKRDFHSTGKGDSQRPIWADPVDILRVICQKTTTKNRQERKVQISRFMKQMLGAIGLCLSLGYRQLNIHQLQCDFCNLWPPGLPMSKELFITFGLMISIVKVSCSRNKEFFAFSLKICKPIGWVLTTDILMILAHWDLLTG